MIMNRVWEMPNKNTFELNSVSELIKKYHKPCGISIDPFANKNKIADVTNDIDPQYGTTYNLDAIEFLKGIEQNSVDFILFDPPYSPRQVSESYKKLGLSVNMETTQSSFWSSLKKEISRISKLGCICISFGWNTSGIGLKNGFKIIEILVICHGGAHNDTLCTVEFKHSHDLKNNLFEL